MISYFYQSGGSSFCDSLFPLVPEGAQSPHRKGAANSPKQGTVLGSSVGSPGRRGDLLIKLV